MIRRSSGELTAADRAGIRTLFDAAWPDGDFSNQDVANAMGGWHWLVEDGGRVVGHASVVERQMVTGGHAVLTGYVEAVAVEPALQRRGIGTQLLAAVGDHIRAQFALGALSTGSPVFYERLGWQRWRGPTYVRTGAGRERTPDDDDGILILPTPTSPPLDLDAAIECDWRAGDVW